MPVLPNPKHENYSRHRANGLSPAKAAQVAGYAPGSGITTELEANEEMKARIQEHVDARMNMKERQHVASMSAARAVGEAVGISRGWVINKLMENASEAAKDGDYKESNAALKMLGEHVGMFGGGGADPNDPNNLGPAGNDLLNATTMEKIENMDDELAQFEETAEKPAPDTEAVKLLVGADLMREAEGKLGKPAPRGLSTGSETDIALREDDPTPTE